MDILQNKKVQTLATIGGLVGFAGILYKIYKSDMVQSRIKASS